MEKTVVKALQVLEALAHSEEPRGISDLARQLGFSKSNVYRLLETLRESSYVHRVKGGNAFELSLKMWHLGAKVTARLDIITVALPYLRELRDKTRETARLTVLHGDQGICIAQIETELPMRIQTPIGGMLLLYCSATGKAMLAFQGQEFIDHIASSMERFTPSTAGSRMDLLAQLDQIRRDGFAINFGERMIGVCGVGAPVANISGDICAAIGISGPAERLNQHSLRKFAPLIRDVACRLSYALGSSGNVAGK
ncbi:MAG: IclR family transcriptional regulator [Casimicrobiaceae bacterium]